jgi:hypothetical protein
MLAGEHRARPDRAAIERGLHHPGIDEAAGIAGEQGPRLGIVHHQAAQVIDLVDTLHAGLPARFLELAGNGALHQPAVVEVLEARLGALKDISETAVVILVGVGDDRGVELEAGLVLLDAETLLEELGHVIRFAGVDHQDPLGAAGLGRDQDAAVALPDIYEDDLEGPLVGGVLGPDLQRLRIGPAPEDEGPAILRRMRGIELEQVAPQHLADFAVVVREQEDRLVIGR